MLSPRPDRKPVAPTPVVESPEFTKLHLALFKIDNRPNILTLATFRRFEPLFRTTHGLTDNQINDLTVEYQAIIDLYKETQIIESPQHPVVVLTLPPLFIPVRTLSNTEHNETVVSVNQKMGTHSIPKYAAEALSAMVRALHSEQTANKPVVEAYQRMYATRVAEFFAKYSKPTPTKAVSPTVSEPAVGAIPDEAEWSYD